MIMKNILSLSLLLVVFLANTLQAAKITFKNETDRPQKIIVESDAGNTIRDSLDIPAGETKDYNNISHPVVKLFLRYDKEVVSAALVAVDRALAALDKADASARLRAEGPRAFSAEYKTRTAERAALNKTRTAIVAERAAYVTRMAALEADIVRTASAAQTAKINFTPDIRTPETIAASAVKEKTVADKVATAYKAEVAKNKAYKAEAAKSNYTFEIEGELYKKFGPGSAAGLQAFDDDKYFLPWTWSIGLRIVEEGGEIKFIKI